MYKDKILVFDSCSLLHILDAIIERIPTNLTGDQRFENFYYSLDNLLLKIRLCSSGARLNTTNQVFEEEINPINAESTLRKHETFIEVCGNNRNHFSKVSRLFQQVFFLQNTVSLDEGILVITRLAHAGPSRLHGIPSRNDMSLLLLSLELSIRKETLLVTDDSALNGASDNILRKRHVNLPSGIVDTQKVLSTSSLSFLQELYGCCEVNNNDFWALVRILDRFIESLKSESNPSYEVRERAVNQIARTAGGFGK